MFGQSGISPIELEEMANLVTKDSPTDCHSDMREANEFINMMKKKESQAKGFSGQISTLHRAV